MVPKAKMAHPKPFDPEFKTFLAGHDAFYTCAADLYIEPFQIFGNLYYVGDQKVCCHLVDTGDGLILFDTGYRNAVHLYLENIRKLGFDPADIRYIIQSHEHFDHFGGSNDIRKLYGSKVCMGAVGTALLRERPDRALMKLGPMPMDQIAWPDIELEDGDVLTLGNTSVRCVLSPGHTPGVMSFFFDAVDGNKTLKVGYFGGVGLLTANRAYNRYFGLPEDLPEQMLNTVEKLRPEQVDITLGNHPAQNNTLEKWQWMLDHPGENPFLDPDCWPALLDLVQERYQELIELGY